MGRGSRRRSEANFWPAPSPSPEPKLESKPNDNHEGNSWPSAIYTKEELKPYKKYKILYGERKFAKQFPEQTQTLSFTDHLPAEVRLTVYEYVGVQAPGRFFELWGPHCWEGAERHDARTRNTIRSYAQFRKVLRLMRLCKKVHGEIAELFYSKQNFRFTNANGLQMMAAWMHTVGRRHFGYLQHITVQIPVRDNRDFCIWSLTKWKKFEEIQRRWGLSVPNYRYRIRHYRKDIPHGTHCYGKAVVKAFEYLESIPGLRKLEFIVPWNYPFISGWSGTKPHCTSQHMEKMEPVERIKHVVEDHSTDPEFWGLLERLKQRSESGELTIAFVLLHGRYDGEYAEERLRFQGQMRAARWLAAYAKMMGYGFGHTRWGEGTYYVEYDNDEMLTSPVTEIQETKEQVKLWEPPEVLAGASGQLKRFKTSATDCPYFQCHLRDQEEDELETNTEQDDGYIVR